MPPNDGAPHHPPRGEGRAELLVFIPAHNEEATIAGVVKEVRHGLDADVLVVDDGSTDATANLAAEAGARVLCHPFNLGVGAAIRSGLRFAEEGHYSLAIQVDGDGQHDVESARALLKALTGNDVVVGSRFAEGSGVYEVSRLRRLAMGQLSGVLSRRLGTTLTDTTSGFRAFGPDAISLFSRAYPSSYLSDTVEALLMCADHGLRVVEVPVTMRERQGGKPSAGRLRSLRHLFEVWLVVSLHRVRAERRVRGGIR